MQDQHDCTFNYFKKAANGNMKAEENSILSRMDLQYLVKVLQM